MCPGSSQAHLKLLYRYTSPQHTPDIEMASLFLLLTCSAALLLPPAPLRDSKSVAALNGHRHTAPRMAEEPQSASADDKAAATAAPAPTAKFDLKSIAKEEAKKGAGL